MAFGGLIGKETQVDLSQYVTETELNSKGFATQSWVNSQGFAKTSQIPSVPSGFGEVITITQDINSNGISVNNLSNNATYLFYGYVSRSYGQYTISQPLVFPIGNASFSNRLYYTSYFYTENRTSARLLLDTFEFPNCLFYCYDYSFNGGYFYRIR